LRSQSGRQDSNLRP